MINPFIYLLRYRLIYRLQKLIKELLTGFKWKPIDIIWPDGRVIKGVTSEKPILIADDIKDVHPIKIKKKKGQLNVYANVGVVKPVKTIIIDIGKDKKK